MRGIGKAVLLPANPRAAAGGVRYLELHSTIVIPSKASHSATTIRDYQIIKNQMPRVKRCFKSFTIWL
jgi:hypothetical protein